MKISKYLGTFALLAMLAACSTEDEQVRFAGDEVKVNATIGGESVFTRSNPVGTEDEQTLFNDNDQIGISVNGGAAHKYEMKNGVWGVAEDPIKWESEVTHFKAFYPYSYNNNVSNSFDKGQISIEQNTMEGLALSDYMTANRTYTGIPENRQLDLVFKRQTARVVIDIENSTFMNEFSNPYVVADINIYSQLELPATQGADVSAIKAYKVDDSNPKSSWVALVAPDAEDANKDFICIRVRENSTGETKEYSIKGIPNLESGKSYTYQLKIGKDKAIINNVEVSDWKEGTAIPGGEASAVTVESIKASVAEQLATSDYVKNVDLTLPANASSDLFEAINTAIKDYVVEADEVNLVLRSVLEIPDNAFSINKGAPDFRKVYLPDVTYIGRQAFWHNNLQSIDAPNVEVIESEAFAHCGNLQEVRFGKLYLVKGNEETGIFNWCNTNQIMLSLSSRQAELKLVDGFTWNPTGQSYWDTEDYTNNSFLGYTFYVITRLDH